MRTRAPSPAAADAPAPAGWMVALVTAGVYLLLGWLALALAAPPGYASPLYPSAGVALAATVVYGRAALPGVALGAFAVNLLLATLRAPGAAPDLLLPALIALGATLQAAVGTALLRRCVGQPLALTVPRDILMSGLLACVACLISPSIATPALLAAGTLGPADAMTNWATWWVGDTLGVLIAAPLALTLIGRPRDDWQPRRLTVALPLLAATAMLTLAMSERDRWDHERLSNQFERDADRLAGAVEARLRAPLHALQAVHSAALVQGGLDEQGLRSASRWWLALPLQLQATGYSVLVARDSIAAFEAAAHNDGLPGYRVFDRRGPGATPQPPDDAWVLALRQIEPRAGNSAALGVNTLSIAAARAAVLEARDSGEPRSTAGFPLTQATNDETGLVLYQALYDGQPADAAARAAAFRGVVFVTVRTERTLAELGLSGQDYLRWCVVDLAPNVPRPRLAGNAGCEPGAAGRVDGKGPSTTASASASSAASSAAATPAASDSAARAAPRAPELLGLETRRALAFGGRQLELRVAADVAAVPGRDRSGNLLLSLAGLVATAMLGALLLTVTGHSRRTERAVTLGTAELRREIGERTQAQQALAESEARLRSILNHIPLGVMFLTPDGTLIDCNPRLPEMLGQDASALPGMSLATLSHPDEAAENRRQRRQLLRGDIGVAQRQLRLRTGAGDWLWVRLVVTALRDGQGRVLRMVAVVEDITEHLRLQNSERALQQAEASNRAKNEFVSRMSHELRTPLNAMIGFSQLLGLDREPGLAPHQRDWTQQIQRAGWHLLEMINETLDLARIEAGAVNLALQPVDVAPLVTACRAMVEASAGERHIRIDERLARDAPAMLADPTRARQILTNLMSNAVKYNRDGGVVTVTARADGPGHVALAVKDSGLGMSPAQLGALWQPYNRLGREGSGIEGTGIGLVISRRLAELMGGTLEAHSAAGTGSTFTLRLPAAAAEVPAPGEAPPPRQPPPYQLRRVHYVEDNETNVEVMRGILAQRPQIRLEVSTMGLDGLSGVRQQRPDLILLDMQLPDISGLELLRHLKQDDAVADIPVIVVSADATPLRMEEALTLGALHYVTKPVEVARFLQLVDEVLNGLETRWGL